MPDRHQANKSQKRYPLHIAAYLLTICTYSYCISLILLHNWVTTLFLYLYNLFNGMTCLELRRFVNIHRLACHFLKIECVIICSDGTD